MEGSSEQVELAIDRQHFVRVVQEGILTARTSVDIATADFKTMTVPEGTGRRGVSIVAALAALAAGGVEVRILHAGAPSRLAAAALNSVLSDRFAVRSCRRLHAKAVIIDSKRMYLGSANLTGAGLGAKASGKRNFEWGILTTSPRLIEGILEQFNALWEGWRCGDCRRREFCPDPLDGK